MASRGTDAVDQSGDSPAEDVVDVELTDSKLQFPESQRATLPYEQETGLFEEGETKCVIDGNEEDADKVFGIQAPDADVVAGKVEADKYRYVCQELDRRFSD